MHVDEPSLKIFIFQHKVETFLSACGDLRPMDVCLNHAHDSADPLFETYIVRYLVACEFQFELRWVTT